MAAAFFLCNATSEFAKPLQVDRAGVIQVLPALKALLDKNESRRGWGHCYLRLLSGDPDGALALLAIDMRHQYSLEWWMRERDPQWANLRTDGVRETSHSARNTGS
jgi:hypothetical protein